MSNKKPIFLKEIEDNKKILITLDEYLNMKGVQFRLKTNRIKCIKMLKDIKDGILNPDRKIDQIIELLEKDEII